VLPGVALGGVLALAGAWSRLARGAAIPHLGVGAVAGLAAILAARLVQAPLPVIALAAGLTGAVAGAAAGLLDRAVVRAATAPGAARHPVPGLLRDLAVLSALLALAGLLRPVTAVPLPFGPLGGRPGTVAAIAALVVGITGTILLGGAAVRALPVLARWAVAGGLVGLAAALAAGALSPAAGAFGGIVGLPDLPGLALRAAAVGLAARRGPTEAIAAGLALGVAEHVALTLAPLSGTALLPVTAVLVVGLGVHVRSRSGDRGLRTGPVT
jgi:hypothetical protein